MASLHMLGHMVAMAIIATLLKQIMELNAEVNKLREQIEEDKETKTCSHDEAEEQEDEHSSDVAAYQESLDEENCDPVPGLSASKDHHMHIVSKQSKTGEHIPLFSSVWCHEGVNQVCQFENLCYNSLAEDFVLFTHESSILENVKMEDGALNVDISTVKNHNTQQTSIVSLPSEAFHSFQVNWVDKTTLVFRPFLPDNLMHMFHDDIIPLHHTLKLISLLMRTSRNGFHDPYNVQLFLFENSLFMSDESEQFYAIFSEFKLKWKDSYKYGSGLTCFKSIFIGLSKSSTWYDYGFTKPQGPIDHHQSHGRFVRSTANFITKNLPDSSLTIPSQEYVVLLSRHENRRILNEVDLTLAIIKATELKVVILNYESYSLPELIWYVSNSKGIIGMHGSLLILCMFLRAGSFVVELFPYAVNPSNYTPYKTLADMNGMELLYKTWVNRIKENSVGHTDWPPELGGLMHLLEEEQQKILAQTDVPPHICCSDPSWLYHIYQDTVVDIGDVSTLVKLAVSGRRKMDLNLTDAVFHPSRVQNIACKFENNSGNIKSAENKKAVLKLHWKTPWTIPLLGVHDVRYEVLLQKYGQETNQVVSLESETTDLAIDIYKYEDYNVWIRCVINENVAGPYTNAVCHA